MTDLHILLICKQFENIEKNPIQNIKKNQHEEYKNYNQYTSYKYKI